MQRSKEFYKFGGMQYSKKSQSASKDLLNVPTQLPIKLYGKKMTFISLRFNVSKLTLTEIGTYTHFTYE